MRTVVLGQRPPELEALIARRRALGQDLFDEVWEGEHHLSPAPHPHHGYVERALARVLAPHADAAGLVETGPFNLGVPDDFRVPDGGYHRRLPDDTWVSTAAIAVEVVSPDDETFAKLDFYAGRGVEELVIAVPAERHVRLYGARDGRFVEVDRSALLTVAAVDLTAAIDWPT